MTMHSERGSPRGCSKPLSTLSSLSPGPFICLVKSAVCVCVYVCSDMRSAAWGATWLLFTVCCALLLFAQFFFSVFSRLTVTRDKSHVGNMAQTNDMHTSSLRGQISCCIFKAFSCGSTYSKQQASDARLLTYRQFEVGVQCFLWSKTICLLMMSCMQYLFWSDTSCFQIVALPVSQVIFASLLLLLL